MCQALAMPSHRRSGHPFVPLVTASALCLTVACSPGPAHDTVRGDAPFRVVSVADAPAVGDVVAATDALGLGILASSDAENVVASPASAVLALGMLAEGARGDTADALDIALGASGRDRTAALNALRSSLAEHDGDPAAAAGDELPDAPLVHVANQAVLDDGLPIEPDYLDALSAAFDAGIVRTDLGAPGAKRLLDDWVRENTGGLVEESAITPDEDSRLVLQDATVFAARWTSPFEDTSVDPASFTLTDGTEVRAEAMRDERIVEYAVVAGWAMARLPYGEGEEGTRFTAEVVLPPEGVDPTALTPAMLADLRDGLEGTRVRFRMPTLDLGVAPTDLRPALEGAGLEGLFSDPDLSGISTRGLAVGSAVQQATLRVDGEGTVAAAVTEVEMNAMAAEPEELPEFVVDRPYAFMVTDEATSWSLFMAAIRDPRH